MRGRWVRRLSPRVLCVLAHDRDGHGIRTPLAKNGLDGVHIHTICPVRDRVLDCEIRELDQPPGISEHTAVEFLQWAISFGSSKLYLEPVTFAPLTTLILGYDQREPSAATIQE